MDFSQHYTEEQQRFRREVAAWLDTHLPEDEVSHDRSVGGRLRARLGKVGWLAPTEPPELGGAGLTGDHELVIQEELARRGLGWTLEDPSISLMRALRDRLTEAQAQEFLPSLNSGGLRVWHTPVEGLADLDPSNIGVKATYNADEYILDGEVLFSGQSGKPDLLWTLAVTDAAAPRDRSTSTFLVPAGLKGVSIREDRRLAQVERHLVGFHRVRVPRYCLVGQEGDGWDLATTSLMSPPRSTSLPMPDPELEGLIRYARETTYEGAPLSQESVRQLLLMDAYINSRVTRLFRMRNAWMRAAGQDVTYQEAQAALWEQKASGRLAAITQDVVGMYALLDQSDPRTPPQGGLDVQQRRSIAQRNASGSADWYRRLIALSLGMGDREEGDGKVVRAGEPAGTGRLGDV